MNRKKTRFVRWLIGFATLLAACEKTISPQADVQPAKLVVDAQIETGFAPLVILSGSLNYFSEIDTTVMLNSMVHNAAITISDGRRTVPLKEVSGYSGGRRYYLYTTSPVPPYDTMTGVPGKNYRLSITVGSQSYTATTTIPFLTKKIDSLWWKKAPFLADTTRNVVLMARVTDPPGLGNYIRYFTQANSNGFFPGRNSVYDDQIVDGTTYDIQVDKAPERADTKRRDDYGYFRRGDTATIRFCNIDKASFEFWRTWEYNSQSIGNPFSSPGKVLGNISNGALGAFCGYAVQIKRLIIPK
ncbi:DUF4249 domain-containing protein [Sediminibacterium soli]|uniref:DUF4249 domain-containing protein n=1 Tax=Sediminibacterium soli TaxID=2698829 RepID=UPI00137A12FF|nr:DUF4249 domain-containing protein [Sediminibacterium soli]NCI46307.1 DUF4249 domain-containing protein [Sediminibacterium soli]